MFLFLGGGKQIIFAEEKQNICFMTNCKIISILIFTFSITIWVLYFVWPRRTCWACPLVLDGAAGGAAYNKSVKSAWKRQAVERIRPFCVWFHKDREKILEAANEKEGKLGAKERKRERAQKKNVEPPFPSGSLLFYWNQRRPPILQSHLRTCDPVLEVSLWRIRGRSLSLVFQSARWNHVKKVAIARVEGRLVNSTRINTAPPWSPFPKGNAFCLW